VPAPGHTGVVAGITVSGVTIDSTEPGKLAAWWAEALGWRLDGCCCYAPGDGLQRLEFMPVPEAKRVKNRVHIDFGADDVQAAVDRLVAMGATIAWEEDFPPELEYRNLVLRDPEGNEFCVGGPGGDAVEPAEGR
jgi:predicted enzyme related to lactoylglutathione lyase